MVQGSNDLAGSDYQVLSLWFFKCTNTTDYQGCKSDEEIDEKLGRSWINIYYTDMIVDTTDFEHPFKYNIGN